MPLSQVGRIVAAQGAADQHGPAEFGDQRFELGHGLVRMVVQRGNPQLRGQAQASHGAQQLAGFQRSRRAVETVEIEDAGVGSGHG
ncbi:hypothetical protein D9M68_666470 [compost metagenome]